MTTNVPVTDDDNAHRFTRDAYDRHVSNIVHRRLNPNSLYNEVTLIEELTLYDIFRQPRALVSTTIDVPPTLLQAELQCPVCLGIIRNATVIKACLHRFCEKCLKECMRTGIKECPSCRVQIGPKRSSLGRDETFDRLVTTIFPDLERFEADEDERIATANTPRRSKQVRPPDNQDGAAKRSKTESRDPNFTQ
ncbi:hypothetical protein LEN26_014086 [Aphanomyces euteiches]|nr:hypothetical protein AeMF1_021487 [Aphanomyces euteiches]KAH9108966.1 hypothetical protein LEN26_014086 [Aphanomyces euteiches]KAH9196911.1 hypothetical protein AeNC1_001114 [Aphanomyces euteiches]